MTQESGVAGVEERSKAREARHQGLWHNQGESHDTRRG
jgi:hypothetical protein